MRDMKGKYFALLSQVREKKPLIHHITNYVTVNDCANITLAIGASPIMADAVEEAADIAGISSALVLNMGTLNERTVLSMLSAGKSANHSNIPVVFDPVGAGASKLRNETAARMIHEVKITVLRGNISEIRYMAGLTSKTKGVDASSGDMGSVDAAGRIAQTLAEKLSCVVAVTGAVDVVSDGKRIILIENGHPMLSNLTGTGCMCSSLIGAFCGASPNESLGGTTMALLCMGVAGEIAREKAGDLGNGSFRVALHDAMSRMNEDILLERAKFYEA